ncbi:MAG: leucyl aminopeptidase family protein [Alphaproteobacteria bacterium]|nr:leucyl aminopeptidase family protein [Alphaproteobacteria bacterium]
MAHNSILDFSYPFPFVSATKQDVIPVIALTEEGLGKLRNKTDKRLLKAHAFKGKAGQTVPLFSPKGDLEKIYVGITSPMGLYDISVVAEKAMTLIKTKTVFELSGIDDSEINNACIAWGLACHAKDRYKSEKSKDIPPTLLLPKEADKTSVEAHIKSICLIRDMINTPANDLGPEELANTIKTVAKAHKASIKIIDNQKTLEKDFPLVFTVGKASDRAPRLIDMHWGKSKNPKITLVGKGVIYDTGGLNIKPGQYMKNMKKDMGGAAHVLALANLIMSMKLPVRLRVIIPAVENAISGPAFRPGDILQSRKGLTVENTNTDAEGRLILADALTLASEEETELIIDCATLTGSARAALGPDVPPFFTTNATIAKELQAVSFLEQDHLWFMPLLDQYNKTIESPIADLVNSAGAPGDLIYSALFLKKFPNKHPDWIHVDMYAWNDHAKAGRPSGGSDTGLRAMYSYLEKRFSE